MANASTYGNQGNQSYENRSTRRRHGLGWVPWVALALLAAIVLGSYLITRNATDSGDQAGVDLTNDPSGQAAATGQNANANAGRPGVFSANGSDVLSSGTISASLAGQTATGNNVVVRSVVADEGFWVSSTGSQQLFVHLTEIARGSQGESPEQVRAGQRVDVSGTLTRVPNDVSTLGVNASEGASQLRQAGLYLDATTMSIR